MFTMAIEAENFETEFFKCQSNELSEQETPMKTEMKSNCDVKGDSENEGHWNCSLFVDRTSENASKGEKIEKLEMTSLTCDKTNEMMPLTCEKSTLVSDNRSLTSENTLLTHVLPVKVDTSVDSTTDLRISNHSCEMRKPPSVDVQNSLKKLEVKSRSGDGLRPVARLIHDLGLDLVRQQVYNDLIKIQEAKDVKHKLNEKEREQLKRLTDSHSKLLIKNANYRLPTIRCRCFFVSTSANVVELHREFGSTAELSFYTCCLCDVFKTHYLSQFQAHLESVHSKKGRIFAKLASHVCKFCPYEHRNQMRMEAHVAKCFKRFSLNANMQPSPADCDIPLMGKVSPMASHQKRPTAALINSKGSRLIQFSKQTHPSVSFSLSAQQQTVMEIKGRLYGLEQQNGKVILTSQQSPSNSSASTARSFSRSLAQFPFPSGKPLSSEKLLPGQHLEKCEMCDTVVNNREMLWNHFCSVHRLEINKESMIDKDPSMACDVCSAKFFTFYGLTRHSVAVHRREFKTLNKSFKCFLCCQVQLNPLNHLSTCHNITVLDMYQSRRCCMCNRKLRTAQAFEEHMVLQHHDIFANKDVLCTVLQALSAALFLKNENVSHARLDRLVPANMKNIIETTSNKNATINKIGTAGIIRKQIRIDEKDALHSISISQTPQVKPGRKKRRLNDDQKIESQNSGINKTPPKKSNEEDTKELNKLYEEFADIGRPILRSMRQRLSHNSSAGSGKEVDLKGLKNDNEQISTINDNDLKSISDDLNDPLPSSCYSPPSGPQGSPNESGILVEINGPPAKKTCIENTELKDLTESSNVENDKVGDGIIIKREVKL